MGFFNKNKIHVLNGNRLIFFLLSILLFISMITFIHVPYLVKDEENSRNTDYFSRSSENSTYFIGDECRSENRNFKRTTEGSSYENYTSLKDLSDSNFDKSNPKYKADNYNVVYHDLEADINVQSGIYKTQNNFYTVLDSRFSIF
jgi:hypothetical protein